ncbi:MAG: hypothetical protein JNM78_10145 [Cyclobacteriaceae bacterium]|nr:hypothetical protein [Cyclobacteriaceae bacterium]
MKRIYPLILGALVAAACSTPKYTASFNSYESHSAKMLGKDLKTPQHAPVHTTEIILASTSSTPLGISNAARLEPEGTKTYIQMTKTERKALRSHVRNEIRTYAKQQKSLRVESDQSIKGGMDNDLKLAAIFGAVGIVALIISGQVFYILGGIALLIGVVFFVKWLIRQ